MLLRRATPWVLSLSLMALAGCDAASLAKVAAAAAAAQAPGAASPAPAGASPAPAGGSPAASSVPTTKPSAAAPKPGASAGAVAPEVNPGEAPEGEVGGAGGHAGGASHVVAEFETDVPDPEAMGSLVAAMTPADIAKAKAAFQQQYAAGKDSAYVVLRMLLGAYSLFHLNEALGLSLASVVVEGGEAPFKTSTGFYWVNELSKKEYAPQTFRSYYMGTTAPDYQVADFAQRLIRVNKDGGATIDRTPVEKPMDLEPKAPFTVGQAFSWGVIPGANKLPRKVKMIYTAQGWKVQADGTITIGI